MDLLRHIRRTLETGSAVLLVAIAIWITFETMADEPLIKRVLMSAVYVFFAGLFLAGMWRKR